MNAINSCSVCGGLEFSYNEVLWVELVHEWELSSFEVDYINRQQGFCCKSCGNNLRSMALADAVTFAYGFPGTLEQFVKSDRANTLKLLEINDAGGLTPFLKRLPNHQRVCYPEYDMTCLSFESETFDIVVHSDTLEHVPDPLAGLSECHRILAKSGRCLFTVPIILGRLTRSRSGLRNSYHGSVDQFKTDLLVHTEFGADMWKFPLEAGFISVRIHSFEYPSGLVIEASK